MRKCNLFHVTTKRRFIHVYQESQIKLWRLTPNTTVIVSDFMSLGIAFDKECNNLKYIKLPSLPLV